MEIIDTVAVVVFGSLSFVILGVVVFGLAIVATVEL